MQNIHLEIELTFTEGEGDIDLYISVLSELTSSTTWPQDLQGEFLSQVAQDILEFCHAIRHEVQSNRWTVAACLMRPLYERAQYLLAGAIKPAFHEEYMTYLERQSKGDFNLKSRPLLQIARGIIDRWGQAQGVEGHIESSVRLNKIASEVLHYILGLSNDAVTIRPQVLQMLTGRVQLALADVILTLQALGQNKTATWVNATRVVGLTSL